jgi:ribonuclease Z
MRPRIIAAILFFAFATVAFAQLQPANPPAVLAGTIRVTLLGTASGPPVRLNRYQMSTLVEAGGQTLLFDCGRGTLLRLAQAGVPITGVNKLFITHLHSDHIVDIPDLYLSGWAARDQRKQSMEIWGPAGTRAMVANLQKAFAFDIHIRRDVDEHFSAAGIAAITHDVQEGAVYNHDGVKVTAFLVDHGPVKPAYGYRVDYAGHSVAISGDTRPSDNLVRVSKGVDVLIHETIDPTLIRSNPGNLSPKQVEAIIAHHTSPEQAGEIFTRVQPRLAVFSHYPDSPNIIPAARRTYSGPLELGEDLMTIEIADKVEVGHAGKREELSHAQEATATKAESATPSSATELSPDQRAGIVEIISEARENGEMVAKRLQSNAKKFDEVMLADTIDPVLEKRCVDGITAAIYDSTQFRLQAATQVVHQLTAEQRRYLKTEMAKPDSEKGILEAVPKVFHLKLEDKD